MSTQPPIACDLSVIGDEKIEDHKQTAETVFDSINEVREITDGYAFRLPADTDVITKTGNFIARERLCCPFFDFTLTIPADQNPVWLKLTGREGVKPYIKETLLPKLDAHVAS